MTMWKQGKPPRRLHRWCAAFAWSIAAVASSVPAAAGSFKVNPVQINLPADRRAASLTISNSDAVPVSIRVLTFAWTQVDGADVYTPTNRVIVSPPIFTIPPGKTQLIRVGLVDRGGPGAYRVIFEEIPRDAPIEGQIQVTLRLNLPLFVLPKGRGKADLDWRAWTDPSGDLIVEGRNRGSLHRQIVGLAASHAGQAAIVSKEMGVVLPGSARRWNLGRPNGLVAGSPLTLALRSPAGETKSNVVLERR